MISFDSGLNASGLMFMDEMGTNTSLAVCSKNSACCGLRRSRPVEDRPQGFVSTRVLGRRRNLGETRFDGVPKVPQGSLRDFWRPAGLGISKVHRHKKNQYLAPSVLLPLGSLCPDLSEHLVRASFLGAQPSTVVSFLLSVWSCVVRKP
jgi:hypothetical protein